ncbi:hypothetical protein IVB18_15955 [Bradyrhizobium sp. 186]|uniref:hypothetical protein n=1 Tax=Bradyrhizobium sp. 186 TaxID=2782654 RepID=UPI0020019D20|nr:hypothetical protein [Bradyrhizobium sp. 186]UPK38597.1 hypothetical protein IVB18_15955 [Bradyrhizobium sp. 186]
MNARNDISDRRSSLGTASLVIASRGSDGQVGPKNRLILFILAFVLAAFLAKIVLPMIDHAKPSLIDDHDIVLALDGGSTVTLSSLGAWLGQTPEYQELLTSGKTSRFRPSYYALKAIEIYTWGDNMRLWYLFRYLADIGTTLIIAALFLRTFGLASALAFVVLYLGHQSWSDLIPRLGPTEFQGNCAAALIVWSAWRHVTDQQPSRCLLWLTASASFLFSTLKEVNSLYLLEASALAVACGLVLREQRLLKLGLLCGLIASIVFAYLLMIVREVSSAVTVAGALSDYSRYLLWDPVFRTIGIAASGLLVVLLLADIRKGRVEGKSYVLLLLTLALEPTRLATYFLTHSIAGVDGFDAFSMRYAFPFVMMQALIIALVVGGLAERLTTLSIPKVSTNVSVGSMFSAAIVVAVLISNRGLFHPSVKSSVSEWQQFNLSADKAIEEAGRKFLEQRLAMNHPALFVSGPTAGIWEPALALALYLKLRLWGTPVYVDVTGLAPVEYGYTIDKMNRYGATPVADEEAAKLKTSCIEVHVDVKKITNSNCDIIQIIKPF